MIFVPCAKLDARTVASLAAQNYDGYFDVLFAFDNPYGQWTNKAYKNVQTNYEKARQIVLRDGYAALWCVEDDMIVPPDALSKLMQTPAPVVSGVYVLRHGSHAPNVREWDGSVKWEMLADARRQGYDVFACDGGCQGCLLIRREALAGFSFVREHDAAPDIDFMRHCKTRGIPQVARLDVLCGHVDSDGSVLRPEAFLGAAHV